MDDSVHFPRCLHWGSHTQSQKPKPQKRLSGGLVPGDVKIGINREILHHLSSRLDDGGSLF